MRTFTKTEIDLCKKIAEKKRKEIKYGDYFEFNGNLHLMLSKDKPEMHDVAIPLWQEHDCLEWLREKGKYFKLSYYEEDIQYWEVQTIIDAFCSKTPLEALLQAVLAVMEKKK